MERRVEIAAPLYDEGLKERVRNMFHIMQCDTVKARQLTKSGKYRRRDTKMLKSHGFTGIPMQKLNILF